MEKSRKPYAEKWSASQLTCADLVKIGIGSWLHGSGSIFATPRAAHHGSVVLGEPIFTPPGNPGCGWGTPNSRLAP